jgi:spore maturation protein CgeB
MKIAFYGSSLLSSYWNGAATYYRGILRDLSARGYSILFFESDAFDRQKHRDIAPPEWARVVVYPATEEAVRQVIAEAATADVVVKASGVGAFDDVLLEGIVEKSQPRALRIFWDVDAPATVAEMRDSSDHILRRLLPSFDLVLTYGGGEQIVRSYEELGANQCIPIYNALDPRTHYPVAADPRFACDLAFLGNRLPDREARIAQFFLTPAIDLPHRSFIIGGSGWDSMPPNVRMLGHIYSRDHNAFNATPLAILNIARDSMARVGFCPATRVFEAAGAGACLITDAWEGLELFLEPDREILVARDGVDVANHLEALSRSRANAIGEAARRRTNAEHTYERRGAQVNGILKRALAMKRERILA